MGLIIWGCGDDNSSNVNDDDSCQDGIKIGNQCWMKNNLDVSTYRNGDPITQVTDPKQWENITTGAWCYYKNDSANGAIYGKLYNWYAVNDPRGLAPEGWHIPSDAEWTTFENYLKSYSQYWCGNYGNFIAKAIASNEHWKTIDANCAIGNNLNANNISGFSALPGGYRQTDGNYYEISKDGIWWSSTEFTKLHAWYRTLSYAGAQIVNQPNLKNYGFSVRCVRD